MAIHTDMDCESAPQWSLEWQCKIFPHIIKQKSPILHLLPFICIGLTADTLNCWINCSPARKKICLRQSKVQETWPKHPGTKVKTQVQNKPPFEENKHYHFQRFMPQAWLCGTSCQRKCVAQESIVSWIWESKYYKRVTWMASFNELIYLPVSCLRIPWIWTAVLALNEACEQCKNTQAIPLPAPNHSRESINSVYKTLSLF